MSAVKNLVHLKTQYYACAYDSRSLYYIITLIYIYYTSHNIIFNLVNVILFEMTAVCAVGTPH